MAMPECRAAAAGSPAACIAAKWGTSGELGRIGDASRRHVDISPAAQQATSSSKVSSSKRHSATSDFRQGFG
jgi:hypothetical protein